MHAKFKLLEFYYSRNWVYGANSVYNVKRERERAKSVPMCVNEILSAHGMMKEFPHFSLMLAFSPRSLPLVLV
jgi:hypothetical protein